MNGVARLGIAIVCMMSFVSVVKAEVGICCYPDGSCVMVEEEDCWESGGCAFYPGAD